MDQEVRHHLLRAQLCSRKRKADFMFPESRRKLGRLDMMTNYINPMTGLVHRHPPYKLNMELGSEHSALGRLKATLPSRQTQGAIMAVEFAETDDTLDVVHQIARSRKDEEDWFDEVRNVPQIPLQRTGIVGAHTLCSFS